MFYPDFLDLLINVNYKISQLDLYIYTYYVCLYVLLTFQRKKNMIGMGMWIQIQKVTKSGSTRSKICGHLQLCIYAILWISKENSTNINLKFFKNPYPDWSRFPKFLNSIWFVNFHWLKANMSTSLQMSKYLELRRSRFQDFLDLISHTHSYNFCNLGQSTNHISTHNGC